MVLIEGRQALSERILLEVRARAVAKVSASPGVSSLAALTLAAVFSVMLVLACVMRPTCAYAAQDGNQIASVAITSTAPWTGQGTQEDPYQIATAADLNTLSSQTNSTREYRGKYFVLTADIDLANKAFTPIGTSAFHFMGTFDGQGHTIKGLNVNSTSQYAGLFGYVAEYDQNLGGSFPATIKNFKLEGSVTSDAAYVGGVVGYATRETTIENVVNKASVTGNMAVGGVVGAACIEGYGSRLEVLNCKNYGAVASDSRQIGGIVGSFEGNYAYDTQSTIAGCANFGTVHSLSTYENSVAGIVGSVSVRAGNKGLDILNCYSTGEVTADKPDDEEAEEPVAYGIVGAFPSGVAKIFTITNCYSTITPYDPAKGSDARITDVEVKTAAEMATDEFQQLINSGTVPEPLSDDPEDTSDVHIGTVAAWKTFADAVNGGEKFKGRVVYLDCDLDLTGMGIAPVGSCTDLSYYTGNYFMGTFDGQGHSITVDVSGTDQVGLFGFVCGTQSGGTGVAHVKNLVVRGSASGKTQYVGGVCGAAAHAVFENVRSEVSVSCDGVLDNAHVGGFVGWASSTARFTSCASRGQVNASGSGCVGGFAGSFTYKDNVAPVLANCYATGSVAGSRDVGGLVGRGMVPSAYSAGFDLKLTSCYAANTVSGRTNVGAVLGSMDVPYSGASGVDGTNSCYDAQLAESLPAVGSGAEASGVSGMTTLNLKLAATTLGSAYQSNATTENDGYPLLSWESAEGAPSTDDALVQGVIDAIAGIGTVTLDSEDAIKAARNAYDALDASGKAKVDAAQPGVLEAAEARLAELKAAQADKPESCIVRFDAKGGSAVAATMVSYGKTLLEPADPERAGFKFAGWTLNGKAYDFATPVTANITLVATWAAVESESGSATDPEAKPSSDSGSATKQNTSAGQDANKKNSEKVISAPAKQKLSGKVKKPSVSAKKLKKAKQTLKVSKLVKVTGAKTTLSYAKAKGSSAKLTVNKKTGAVSVKKGTKKGTYTLKLKVTAAKTAKYKAASKTFTVKVKVK